MPKARHSSVMLVSCLLQRSTNSRRCSMGDMSFQGTDPPQVRTVGVTHVLGPFCHPCARFVPMTVEGSWVDRVVDGVRNDIAMLKTPDGHGRLELIKFHAPSATTAEPNAPVNTLGIRRIMFAVEHHEDVR